MDINPTVRVKSTEEMEPPRKKRKGWRKTGLIALVAVTVVSAATAAVLYKQNQDLQASGGAGSSKRNAEETKHVLERLGKVMHIDEKDKPTVARVTKPELLKKNNKTFYKDVQVGDYLILYTKRAIIFREAQNMIVNVAPILNANQIKAKDSGATSVATPVPTPTPTPKR